MIAWQIDFRALWDNDKDGRERYAQAAKLFGTEIEVKNLRLLPPASANSKRIIQDLFDGTDLVKIRSELGLSDTCAFEHTIHALFYSPQRAELVAGMSQVTKQNFKQLFECLSLD